MHAFLEERLYPHLKEDKAKIIEKFKVGDILKVQSKGYSLLAVSLM